MTKTELIEQITLRSSLSQKQAQEAINALIEITGDVLERGEELRLLGLGTFRITEHAARTGRNPKTGESMLIPASKKVAFRPSSMLQDRVNK